MDRLTPDYLQRAVEVLKRQNIDAGHNQEQIISGLSELGKKYGIETAGADETSDFHHLIDFLFRRVCGVPDTPRATAGIHVLDYGTPIGRWSRGNLKVGVLPAGFQGSGKPLPNPVAIAANVYGQYAAAAPFFSFTFLPPGTKGDLTVQFGGDPSLGTPGGPLGLGDAPESGSLKMDAGTKWSQLFLTALMLHEAGHTLGLSHSTNPNSVMYPFAPNVTVLDPETIEILQSMYGWVPQRPLSDRASSHGPSLAVVSQANFTSSFETAVMVWKGTPGDSSLWWATSGDGLTWSPQQQIPNTGSSEGPCVAAYNIPSRDGALRQGAFMAWKGVHDDHNIYWAVNPDLGGWTDQQRVDVGTSSRPALAEFNGQMVMAWKGVPGDSGIYWSKFDGINSWSPQAQIAGRGTSDSPVLSVFGGQLHMFWKGIGGDDTVWHAVLVDPGNGIWGPQQQVSFIDGGELSSGQTPIQIGTSTGLSATPRGDELVLMWKGVPGDHAIWFSRLSAAGTFSGQVSIAGVGTESYPAITTLNGKLIAAWRGIGDDHQLWVSSLG